MKKIITQCLLTGSLLFLLLPVHGQKADSTALFVSGEGGYSTYRIPAIITTSRNTLLAFCEGRKNHGGDAGDIDMLVKRSEDGGATWSAQQVIWDDSINTCGNPCPVVDETTGAIWLLMTHNNGGDHETDIIKRIANGTRTIWVTKSEDDGRTWSEPVNITDNVKKPGWGWFATGPGIGIQIQYGPHKGRMVIPCDYSYDDAGADGVRGTYGYGVLAVYSDDHGKTWKGGGTITPRVNECQVVELADGNGTLLMNMRSYFGRNLRTHSTSYDGGLSWTAPADVPQLVEPVCQAGILRYSWPGKRSKSRILFLNPASSGKRHNMSMRVSYDEGATWPVIKTLYAGPSAYSCMAVLANGNIACLYEAGNNSPYEAIIFQVVKAKEIFSGEEKK